MSPTEFKNLSVLMERVIHEYVQIEQRTWDYGNGLKLSRPEIHTIMLVSANPGISVTALAKKRGITKGAASQLIYKMVDRGLIEKRVSSESDAQVSLTLTDLGREINALHDEYHRTNAEPLFAYLKELPDETARALIDVMAYFDEALANRLK